MLSYVPSNSNLKLVDSSTAAMLTSLTTIASLKLGVDDETGMEFHKPVATFKTVMLKFTVTAWFAGINVAPSSRKNEKAATARSGSEKRHTGNEH